MREFREEKQSIARKARVETAASEGEISKLQRMLELKDRETNKVGLMIIPVHVFANLAPRSGDLG